MVRHYIRTIKEMEDQFYGSLYDSPYMQKSDAPVISTTTGIYNAVYGAKCWVNLNLEANAFGMIRKVPWDRSGWRVITARASSSVTGGVAENGTIPETNKPTFGELSTKPKTVAHAFDTSEVMQFLGTVDDSLEDVMAALREYMAKEHSEHINKMLLTDNDTLAGNNIDSLDRVLGSYAEITACGQTAGDLDIFGLDRDAGATYADAYVSQNGTTDRSLSLSLIDSMFQNIWTNGGNPDVILTGYDTLMATQQLLQSQQRFMESSRVVPSVEGVQGVEGINAGFIVATYNQVPIIPSKNQVQDTISRMMFLDNDYLALKVAKPTQYFESGILSGDPFGINRLGQEGMYRSMAELNCMFFAAQGKLRELM